MTAPVITLAALALVGIPTALYALWYRRHKRQAERVYTWTEWTRAKEWYLYPRVDVRPLDKPMQVGKDID